MTLYLGVMKYFIVVKDSMQFNPVSILKHNNYHTLSDQFGYWNFAKIGKEQSS